MICCLLWSLLYMHQIRNTIKLLTGTEHLVRSVMRAIFGEKCPFVANY